MRTYRVLAADAGAFGATYAASVAADYRLPALGSTVDEALAAGVEAKDVWRAVCAEFEMPASLR